MSDLLVRGLDVDVLKRLKARAKRNERSLQAEAKVVLENAAAMTLPQLQRLSGQWRTRLAGRRFPDSATLVRQDRRR